MPLFEYRCPKCKQKTEELRPMSRADEPPPKCEACETEMVKQVSAFTFALKGGGWAKDGYA